MLQRSLEARAQKGVLLRAATAALGKELQSVDLGDLGLFSRALLLFAGSAAGLGKEQEH